MGNYYFHRSFMLQADANRPLFSHAHSLKSDSWYFTYARALTFCFCQASECARGPEASVVHILFFFEKKKKKRKKSLSFVTMYRKYTWALTLENFSQGSPSLRSSREKNYTARTAPFYSSAACRSSQAHILKRKKSLHIVDLQNIYTRALTFEFCFFGNLSAPRLFAHPTPTALHRCEP